MASKEIKFSEEAWRALERGVDSLANAVKLTLGYKGRNVLCGSEIRFSPPLPMTVLLARTSSGRYLGKPGLPTGKGSCYKNQ